jgi:hypothetical protein
MTQYGRYGYQGAPTSRDERSSGPVFALMRAWAVGILILLTSQYLQVTFIYEPLVGPQGTRSFGAALLLVHLPNAVCIGLATWAAARVHPEPHRHRTAQHWSAAFVVPAVGQLLSLAIQWDRISVGGIGFWMSNAALLTGCAVGFLLDRLPERSGR